MPAASDILQSMNDKRIAEVQRYGKQSGFYPAEIARMKRLIADTGEVGVFCAYWDNRKTTHGEVWTSAVRRACAASMLSPYVVPQLSCDFLPIHSNELQVRHFLVTYFMADDTVEIKERLGMNAGRDPQHAFVSRRRLVKDPRKQVCLCRPSRCAAC